MQTAVLVGIKGSRGRKTHFAQYAKEIHGLDRSCLYINLNNLYFTEHLLRDFAERFYGQGGRVLLIDQVFKYPGWSEELKYCYDHLPELKIIFSGSSVMRLKERIRYWPDWSILIICEGFHFGNI